MSRKHVLLAGLIVLLVGTLGAAFNVQKVKASGTIYIRADGTIDPLGAPIEGDGTTYNFTADINDQIVVMRSNIIIDGKGHTLQGSGIGSGFSGTGINNVTILQTTIRNFTYGVFLDYSHGNRITGNVIRNNSVGVYLYGVLSVNNTVVGSLITGNGVGVEVDMDSASNQIYYNNFIDNGIHARVWGEGANTWNRVSPEEVIRDGNYWSGYTGEDEDPEDGRGDTPYEINENNVDYHPLMGMFSGFCFEILVSGEWEWRCVQVISDSEVENTWYGLRVVGFDVIGPDGTEGFCRVTIPHDLVEPPHAVIVNDNPVMHRAIFYNETLTVIYFTYNHSRQEVIIVPEFPSFIIPPLFMTATLLAVIIIRRKHGLTSKC